MGDKASSETNPRLSPVDYDDFLRPLIPVQLTAINSSLNLALLSAFYLSPYSSRSCFQSLNRP